MKFPCARTANSYLNWARTNPVRPRELRCRCTNLWVESSVGNCWHVWTMSRQARPTHRIFVTSNTVDEASSSMMTFSRKWVSRLDVMSTTRQSRTRVSFLRMHRQFVDALHPHEYACVSLTSAVSEVGWQACTKNFYPLLGPVRIIY